MLDIFKDLIKTTGYLGENVFALSKSRSERFAEATMQNLASVKPHQKVVRRYILEADYEYNPELKVKK